MELTELVNNLTPERFANLKAALEIGKWSSGRLMTDAERIASMQAVILYEHQHINHDERTGYLANSCAKQTEKSSILRIAGDSTLEMES